MRSSRNLASGGLVAAPQAEAAFEARRVLEDGGNAADALVTGALVQGVVDPHRCGIGGFGCATLWFRGGANSSGANSTGAANGATRLAVDFHGRAGSRARPDLWEKDFESETPDGFGYLVSGKVNDVGYRSITVPGMLAGLAEIHGRFGRLDWSGLVRRAIPYAEDGFVVTPELAEFWIRPGLHGRVSTRDRLSFTPQGAAFAFRPDGATYQAGEIFRQPALARTYARLADEGAESFYRGALAREITADWAAHDALVTAEDLASYRAEVREPVARTIDDLEILSTPLPGGGVALLQTLLLAGDIDAYEHNSPEYIDALGRVLRAVWSDRLSHQGDPAFCGREEGSFLDASWLGSLRERAGRAPQAGMECSDTTQISIVDADGNAISFSHSLGYNSGVFAPGLGALFNNCMSAFDPRPGSANSIAPGKARSTAVAETIVLRDGSPELVLGSPGAARITAGLAQVLLNVYRFGKTLGEAVVEPRFDAYGSESPGVLVLESRFPPSVAHALEARGWKVNQSVKPFGIVGRVYAARVLSREPLRIEAGVDPGAPGAAYTARAR